jgi:hypothetical protein
MGTQFEKRDLFLNPVPSNVGEEEIKRALKLYNISTIRVTVRQRVNDNTRFAFVSPQSAYDFEQLKQVRYFYIKGINTTQYALMVLVIAKKYSASIS